MTEENLRQRMANNFKQAMECLEQARRDASAFEPDLQEEIERVLDRAMEQLEVLWMLDIEEM